MKRPLTFSEERFLKMPCYSMAVTIYIPTHGRFGKFSAEYRKLVFFRFPIYIPSHEEIYESSALSRPDGSKTELYYLYPEP